MTANDNLHDKSLVRPQTTLRFNVKCRESISKYLALATIMIVFSLSDETLTTDYVIIKIERDCDATSKLVSDLMDHVISILSLN